MHKISDRITTDKNEDNGLKMNNMKNKEPNMNNIKSKQQKL
jgi:hypothetical protein